MTGHEQFIAALNDPKFSHVSVRQWCGLQSYVYHHDATSPSGVILVAGLPEEEARPILNACSTPSHFGAQRGDLAFADNG